MMRVGVTPVPIPNTLVKTDAADNTWLETTREDRWLPDLWGISSVGRAPALQAGGQEFDPPHLHHRASEDGNDDRTPKIKWACSSGG